MKYVMLASLALTIGAAPPSRDVPIGHFVSWGGASSAPLRFRSGNIEVSVTALPCPAGPVDDRGCAARGIDNQARIIVTAPGFPVFTTLSDPSASLISIAVGRLDRRSSRPGVIIDNAWTGTLGINTIMFLSPSARGFHAVTLRDRTGNREVAGEITAFPRDVSGDGIVDVVLEDVGFAYVFGCGACTPRPPVILSVVGGRSVDLSTDRATRRVFANDMIRARTDCRSHQDYRNGSCAAYVADAARLGQFGAAWRDMLSHYERGVRGGDLWDGCSDLSRQTQCFRTFPGSLRSFLAHAGYITAAQAAGAPLS